MKRNGEVSTTNALFALILFGVILFIFVKLTLPLLEKKPISIAGYNQLAQNLERLDTKTNYAQEITLEEKGSALLFFNSGTQTLTEGIMIFQRPESCGSKSCICNCPTLQFKETEDKKQQVTCTKPQPPCQSSPYLFFDKDYYEKDSPQNQGYILTNLGGGLTKQPLYLELYQQNIVIVCDKGPCIRNTMRPLLTFDQLLRPHLLQCLHSNQACADALQNFNQIIDKDHSIHIFPENEQTLFKLLTQDKTLSEFKLLFSICLTDQTKTEQLPVDLQWDPAQSKILVSNHGPLKNLLAESLDKKDQICLVYLPS